MNQDTFQKRTMTDEERAVYQVYRKMQDAMISKDIAALDHIILDGTRMKHMSGRTQSKQEYFDEIQSGILNYYHTDMRQIDISVNGDHAVLKCTANMRAKVYGMSGTFPLHADAHFQKINGEWFYIDSPKPN